MAQLATAARRKLASYMIRTLNSSSSPSPSYSSSSYYSSRCLSSLPFLHKITPTLPPRNQLTRFKSTRSGYSPLNDPSPNWSNRPPRETILLDGCDYEHWLIVMEFPEDPTPSEEEMINSYVKTLASVLGSEEEAKKKIYSVSTRAYTGFGALISEELSYKVKELPGVLWVLPDSYLDVPNKDYGGDLFIDGKVIHRPQFWYQNMPQNQGRNRSRARYDRRRETIQVQRREPMQMQSPDLNQGHDPQQQPNTQNLDLAGGAGSDVNQGPFNQSHN